MNIQKINQFLSVLSFDELKQAQTLINTYISLKVNERVEGIEVGDNVKVNHPKVAGMKLVVVKVNRKRMKLKHVQSNRMFTFPLSMIQKVA